MPTIESNLGSKTTQLDENIWANWKYPLIAFIVGFFILIPLAFLSLDMHDPGFFLSNQLVANKMGLNYFTINSTMFLSDVIGGWWLRLTSGLGLVGAKLGGVIIYATCAALTVKIFQQYVQSRIFLLKAAICALLVATFSLHRMSLTLHPNVHTIPMLFGLIYVTFSIDFIKKPNITNSICSGCLLTVLYFCRFTMIVLWIVPLLSVFFIEKGKRKLVLITYAVAILSSLLFLSMLDNGFQVLSSGIRDIIKLESGGRSGGLWFLAIVHLMQIVKALSVLGYVCLAAFPFVFLKDKMLRNKIVRNLVLFVFIVIGLGPFLPSKNSALPWFKIKPLQLFFYDNIRITWLESFILKLQHFKTIGLVMSLILVLAISYVVLNLLRMYRRKTFNNKALKELLFITLVAMVFILSFLGSPAGIDKACFGIWLLICLCIAVSHQKWQIAYLNRWLIAISFISFAFLYTCFHMDYLYSFSKLSFGKEGVMKGTITLKEKNDALAELLPFIGGEVEKGDYIFGYHSMPMIYYLTDTVPITLTDYTFVTMRSKDLLEKHLNQYFSEKTPKVIIKSKFNPFRPNWNYKKGEYKSDVLYADFFSARVDLIEKKLDEFYKPVMIWSNDAFEVYIPGNKGAEKIVLD